MKQRQRDQIVDITKIILKTLFAVGAVVTIITLPGVAHISKLFDSDKKYKRKFDKELDRLDRSGFVKIHKNKNGETAIKITKKGEKRVLRYNLEELKVQKPKKWDKLWRMVVFDVPEENREARASIRRKLKDLGFFKYQKSVFVYPYPCKDEVDFIGNYFDIRREIKYIIIKEIEDDKKLRRFFDI